MLQEYYCGLQICGHASLQYETLFVLSKYIKVAFNNKLVEQPIPILLGCIRQNHLKYHSIYVNGICPKIMI